MPKFQEGGGGVNWPFKNFSQNQYLSQYTKNKSIYLKMNRFILALLMFKKNVYISQNILKIMQINLQVTHTLILERKPVNHKTATFNFKQVIKVQLIAWQLIE